MPERDIFQCRQCGYCCKGETTVSLDAEDLARLANHFRVREEELFDRYLRKNGSVVQMRVENGYCIFYREGCTIHRSKPWRCRQWPLHPSILRDESNFSAIKDSCPGIKGAMGYEAFCARLARLLSR